MAKRLLAALVCVLMVLAMLVGCSSQPVASVAPTTTTAPTTAPEASAAAPTAVEKKEVTINWGANFSSDPNNDDFGKWIQSNFKIKIVQVAIDSEDKVKMLAASDTLPDMIGMMGIGDATFNQLKTDGMIRDIPNDMLAKYPILKKVIDEQPTLNSFKASLQKNYWLPIYGDADKPFTAAKSPYYYRADWAQKLGIAAPTTMDEFYSMLKAFTEKDPDGNGQNDTYGISGWCWQAAFIAWVDMYSWEKGDDGKWIPGFISPKMLDALKFYNRLYQEKILDPEFAGANPKSMFYQDKIGCFVGNGDYYWIWTNIYKNFTGAQHSGKSMTADEAMAAVQFLPPLKVDANTPAQWAPNMDTAGFAINAKTTDEVLDRILEIANWQLSPEGRDMMTYGFKDKDWMVKDGKAVSLLPNNPSTGVQKRLWEIYPCLDGITIAEGYLVAGTPWLNSPLPQPSIDRMMQFEDLAAPSVIKENWVINNLSTPLKDKCTIVPPGACEADFQKLIASSNIQADWDALIKSYMETQGLKAAIEEVNATIASQGLDK